MPISLTRRQIETLVAALVAIAAAAVGLSTREAARELGPKFASVERVAQLKEPVYLAQPPGAGAPLYIVQRQGTVRVLAADKLLQRPFLNIKGLIEPNPNGGEEGLQSIAFPPDYARSGVFYVAYTDRRNAFTVMQYRRDTDDPLAADPDSARTVISIPQPTRDRNGSLIAFGPDGHLYIGAGDGSPKGDPAAVSQNTSMLLGKILRIDPLPPSGRPGDPDGGGPRSYATPSDNPFVGGPGRDEIWAYGLGDPRRFSFDRPTRTVGIADVGNERFEEIEYLPIAEARGANFGWPAYDGFARFRGGIPRRDTVFPAIAYPRRRGCTVIGGYLVRDPRLARIRGRELFGSYLYGNRCSGRLYAFRPRQEQEPGKLRSFRFRFSHLVSFGQDNSGRIYVLTEKGPSKHGKPTFGSVFRLVTHRKEA
jgi:glucose/arabinose dehydrogenase